MAKTINGRTVLVTNMLRFVLALGCFVMNDSVGATSIIWPTIDYEGISYKRLIILYKEELVKVGFVIGKQTEFIRFNETFTEIQFGFSSDNDQYLPGALFIRIHTTGKRDGICSPCTEEDGVGGWKYDIKLAQELNSAIALAKEKAEIHIKTELRML